METYWKYYFEYRGSTFDTSYFVNGNTNTKKKNMEQFKEVNKAYTEVVSVGHPLRWRQLTHKMSLPVCTCT